MDLSYFAVGVFIFKCVGKVCRTCFASNGMVVLRGLNGVFSLQSVGLGGTVLKHNQLFCNSLELLEGLCSWIFNGSA